MQERKLEIIIFAPQTPIVMKDTIDYSQTPTNYLICLNRECSKAGNCLRQLVAEVVPPEVKQLNIINPKYLTTFKSDCPYYKVAEKMRYAKGFIKMLENMPYKQMQNNGWNIQDASLYLDRFGNKIAFEKKLNIQAGNGYFGIKKQRYQSSKIASVIELSEYYKNDWTKEDIETREIQFKETIVDFFKENLVN